MWCFIMMANNGIENKHAQQNSGIDASSLNNECMIMFDKSFIVQALNLKYDSVAVNMPHFYKCWLFINNTTNDCTVRFICYSIDLHPPAPVR